MGESWLAGWETHVVTAATAPGGKIPSACCPVSPFGSAHTFGKAHLKVKVQQLVGIVSGSLPLGAVPAELSKTLAN